MGTLKASQHLGGRPKDEIENYPGLEKVNGFELIMKFKNQAVGFGLETRQGTVKSITKKKAPKLKKILLKPSKRKRLSRIRFTF